MIQYCSIQKVMIISLHSNIQASMNRKNKPYRYKDENGHYKAVQRGNYSDKSMEKFRAENRIHTSATGKEYIKYYLKDAKSTLGSVWTDIYGFGTKTASKERTGYPTQKPLALYERIIKASSKRRRFCPRPFLRLRDNTHRRRTSETSMDRHGHLGRRA